MLVVTSKVNDVAHRLPFHSGVVHGLSSQTPSLQSCTVEPPYEIACTHQPSDVSARSVMLEVAAEMLVYVSTWPFWRSLAASPRTANAPSSRLIEISPFVPLVESMVLEHVCVLSTGGGGDGGGGDGGDAHGLLDHTKVAS